MGSSKNTRRPSAVIGGFLTGMLTELPPHSRQATGGLWSGDRSADEECALGPLVRSKLPTPSYVNSRIFLPLALISMVLDRVFCLGRPVGLKNGAAASIPGSIGLHGPSGRVFPLKLALVPFTLIREFSGSTSVPTGHSTIEKLLFYRTLLI